MTVALGDHIDQIRSGVESAIPLGAATRLKIDLVAFYLPDGMQWSAGKFATPDPRNPGGWLRKDSSYFPGLMERNWPDMPGWVDPQ
jgi:hypothetical protein